MEQVRQRYTFVVVGYVVTPGHIHLLRSEPEKGGPSRVMQVIMQGFARRVLRQRAKRRVWAQQELCAREPEHVWQYCFYDFNLWSKRNRNAETALQRGPIREPEQWAWSSFRSYYYGEVGTVRINQWRDLKIKIRTMAV